MLLLCYHVRGKYRFYLTAPSEVSFHKNCWLQKRYTIISEIAIICNEKLSFKSGVKCQNTWGNSGPSLSWQWGLMYV